MCPGRSGVGPRSEGEGFFTRSGNVLCQGVVLRYQAIERCRHEFSIRMMCRLLRVSPSGFHDWLLRPVSAHQKENQRLLTLICQMHADSQGALGAPRMHEDLVERGETASKNRIARSTAAWSSAVWAMGQHPFVDAAQSVGYADECPAAELFSASACRIGHSVGNFYKTPANQPCQGRDALTCMAS